MKTFKDYIHNKTIALVGPAKYMENTNLGSEIDNHDVVIRINRGIELNNTEHIGSKSDIL